MGAAYSQVKYGLERPTVALLSNGIEATKGTEALREAHRLLNQTDINYIGFVEGRQVPEGCADVVVTDGLMGNVVLKLCEGLIGTLFDRVRRAIQGNLLSSLVSPMLKRPLRKLFQELDWESVGAAPILGLKSVALVGHGQTSPKAISNAIMNARAYAASGLIDAVGEGLAQQSPDEMTNTSELPLSQTGEGERRDQESEGEI
jgi:glycerol-3-phosphate acyltransferase PlsX